MVSSFPPPRRIKNYNTSVTPSLMPSRFSVLRSDYRHSEM